MGISPEQEPAVASRGRDMAVTAGAGTGKTRTLVARYLALLAEGLELPSLLAVTFTRKAAREMRNRVRDEVRRYQQRPDLAEDERQHWRDLYSRLDAARIDTIHGLCGEILRHHPAEAGVDPRFDVLEEGQGNILRSRAVDEALAWAADSPQAAGLFPLLGERDLRQALDALLKQRLDAGECFAHLPADVLGFWQAALSRRCEPATKKGRRDPAAPALNPQDALLAEWLPALQATLQQALACLQALKEERRTLDFDDLESQALLLLQQHQAVRAYWQSTIAAILVDEFQDTNQRQRDLVDLINGGRGRLFLVGDAKQSIYRFRGADVTVFRRERERIAVTGGTCLSLQTSYRAHQELVQGLNDLLRPVLGTESHPERPWVEPFAPLQCHRQEAAPGFRAPHIELHLTVGTKTAGALDRAARALAGRLAELVSSGCRVLDGGSTRPLDYGGMAVLCRASNSFAPYEDAFEQVGIPFVTVAGRGFYGRPEVRDLLNALLALADPSDDLALVGLLRSPALGLSDAALYHLCQARGGAAGQPLWATLQAASRDLPAEDGQAAQRAMALVSELHNQAGRTPVADLLKAFLDATGYRTALLQVGDTRGARNVAKLLADAHGSGIVGVGEFLEYVAGLRDTGTREGEARATVEGVVQIMSVHQAKGLEFPVVVIGDVTYEPKARNRLLLDRELGVLLPLSDEDKHLPASYALAKERAQDQEQAESDRLFYVAATRAQEKLILSGLVNNKKDGTVGKTGGWLGKVAGRGALHLEGMKLDHKPDGVRAVQVGLRIGTTPVACTLYEPHCPLASGAGEQASAAETAATLPPPLLRSLDPLARQVDPRVVEQERMPPQRVWRVVPVVERPLAPAWVVGKLVHEALAAWSFPQDSRAAGVSPSFQRWAEARARGYGLTDPEQLQDAVSRCARLLASFRAHPLYAEMAAAESRLHEVPYSRLVHGRVESGILDALYRREGRWTIVEFKTDELRDEVALQHLLREEDYLAQAQRYLAAAQDLLGQMPRLRLCLLNYARGVRLLDAAEVQRLA